MIEVTVALETDQALENAAIIYALDIVRTEQVANERIKAKIARVGVTIYPAGHGRRKEYIPARIERRPSRSRLETGRKM
jgi:hypothetical protein